MLYFIVREISSREDGDFLFFGDIVYGVNGGDVGLDYFFRVDFRLGVNGLI